MPQSFPSLLRNMAVQIESRSANTVKIPSAALCEQARANNDWRRESN